MPVSRTELDAMGCSTLDCNHDHSVLWLNQNCHPDAGARVRYVKDEGVLYLQCAECEKDIDSIWVGEKPTLDS